MKLITTAVLLLLLTHPGFSPQKPSQKPDVAAQIRELQKLEKRLNDLKLQDGDVTVELSGDNESSAKINVVVEKTEAATDSAAEAGGKNKPKKKRSEFDIDLSNIEVPDEYINEKFASTFLTQQQFPDCPGVKVMQVGATADYEVVEDYTYQGNGYQITAWKGFTYDRASIPRIFWVIIDKDSLSNVAPLFHDLLYRHGGVLPQDRVSPYRSFTRDQTDNLFKELMGRCGVDTIRQELAYQAVHQFAGPAWRAN